MENNFKFCPTCGNKVKATAKFCPKCGTQFSQATFQQQQPQQPNGPNPQYTRSSLNNGGGSPNGNGRLTAIILAIVVVLVVIAAGGTIITQQQTRAKKAAIIQSSQLKESIHKAKQAKANKLKKQLASDSVDVVTDLIQNNWNIDAECDDVTITSSYGNDQYGGYADISDDDGDEDTVDVTVTNVKYDDTVSIEIDGDDHQKLLDDFYTY